MARFLGRAGALCLVLGLTLASHPWSWQDFAPLLSEDYAAFRAYATLHREAKQVTELLLQQPGTRRLLASPGVSSALRGLKRSAAKEESRQAAGYPEEDEWSFTPGRQQVGCKFVFCLTLSEALSSYLLLDEAEWAQLPKERQQSQMAAYAFVVRTLRRMAEEIDGRRLRAANSAANSAATALLGANWAAYDAFYDARAALLLGSDTPELALAGEDGDLTCPEDVAVLRALTSQDGELGVGLEQGVIRRWSSTLAGFFENSQELASPWAADGNIAALQEPYPHFKWAFPTVPYIELLVEAQDAGTIYTRYSPDFIVDSYAWFAWIDSAGRFGITPRTDSTPWGQEVEVEFTVHSFSEGTPNFSEVWRCSWGSFEDDSFCMGTRVLPLAEMLANPAFSKYDEMLVMLRLVFIGSECDEGACEPELTSQSSWLTLWAFEHVDPVFWGSVGFPSRLLPHTGVDALPDALREAGGRSPRRNGHYNSEENIVPRGHHPEYLAEEGQGDVVDWLEQDLEDAMADLAALVGDRFNSGDEHEITVPAMLWGTLTLLAILGLAAVFTKKLARVLLRWVASTLSYRGQRHRSRAPRRAPRVVRPEPDDTTFFKAVIDFLLLGVAGLFISPCTILQKCLQCLRRALASGKQRAVQVGRQVWAALQAGWSGLCARSNRRRSEAGSRPQEPSQILKPAPSTSKTIKKGPRSSTQKRDGKRQVVASSSQKQRAAQRPEREPVQLSQQQQQQQEPAADGQAAGSSDEQQPTPDASPRREQAALIGASPSPGPSAPSEIPALPPAIPAAQAGAALPAQALPEAAQRLPEAAHGQLAAQSPAAAAAAVIPGLDDELLQMLFPSGSQAQAGPRSQRLETSAPLAPTSSSASAASSQAESVQPLPEPAEPPAAERPAALLPAAGPPAEELEECVVCMANPPAATLAPCGHRVLCVACVLLVLAPRKRGQAAFCPICGQEAESYITREFRLGG